MGENTEVDISMFTKKSVLFGFQLIGSNEVWQSFNYKKRPRNGLVPDLFRSKDSLKKIRFLKNEIFIYGLVTYIQLSKLDGFLNFTSLDYSLEYLTSQDPPLHTAFGFSNSKEFIEYYEESYREYTCLTPNVENFSKVFIGRGKRIQDNLFTIAELAPVIRLVDFVMLKIYLHQTYENIEFNNDID